ncbi:MAG: sugar-binding transcriptional regulator [Chloroflexota bacterium]
MRHSRLQLLATIADLYYVEQQNQSEIARKTGYSRSAISRLLTEARNLGVVEIRINHPLQRLSTLEYELIDRFGLQACFVAQRGLLNYPRMQRLLGRLGAAYLSDNMQPDSRLSAGWGMGVYEVAQAFRERYWPNFQIIQMMGATGSVNATIDGPGVVTQIANTFSGTCRTLNAPLYVESQETRAALLRERNIRATLDLASNANFALTGIASIEPERSGIVRAGHLDVDEHKRTLDAGAIGDICGQLFDENGRILDIDINHRVIGVDLTMLQQNGCTIVGVAGGRIKAPAIRGALRGRLINVLVTDSSAAEIILGKEATTVSSTLN